VTGQDQAEGLLRELAPQVLGTLARRHGQFDACEDAVQEALLAAALQWPADGVPERPRAWLLTVAGRALADEWLAESARRRRETAAALDPAGLTAAHEHGAPGANGMTRSRCCSCAVIPPCRHLRSSRSPCERSAA
jgi:predicted RNA polymerase sigma factor